MPSATSSRRPRAYRSWPRTEPFPRVLVFRSASRRAGPSLLAPPAVSGSGGPQARTGPVALAPAPGRTLRPLLAHGWASPARPGNVPGACGIKAAPVC